MNKKSVSIIIPAWNEQDYIRDTISSYRKQEEQTHHELIVVANGCHDDTANIAHDLGTKVIELEEANVSVARNIGAKHASSELLIFNDADTLAAPNYINVINKATDKGYDFGCALFKPENYHPISLLYSLAAWSTGFRSHDTGGNMFVRKELFDSTGGYKPELRIGEDTDLGRRLKANGGKFKFLHSTHIVTSLRKFKRNGYFTEFFGNQMWPDVKETFLPAKPK